VISCSWDDAEAGTCTKTSNPQHDAGRSHKNTKKRINDTEKQVKKGSKLHDQQQ
jgi:hypothetical protein